ncbi:hypothetical protein C4D60_Mb00t19160 [Musa balbisiana]|uniref:X8 domain-containing protein n=1 Tax=Musa balbisiana TaxID=52838 RepID=A0A4S8I3J3_MUSBA|nr:hypothetical protein C4D60_Mb00t19160 [Musa balbisiana]
MGEGFESSDVKTQVLSPSLDSFSSLPVMAALALVVLIFTMFGGSGKLEFTALICLCSSLDVSSGGDKDFSYAAWCVCKPEMSDTALQKTLDFACGAGADCTPILQNGACTIPTSEAHCSYAANSYYQRKGQAQGTCDFSGTAALAPTDPSYSGCAFPATARYISEYITINEHDHHLFCFMSFSASLSSLLHAAGTGIYTSNKHPCTTPGPFSPPPNHGV